jgi:ubiquinone/menaquinone biosynthesis C-methylase UbiE
MIKIINKKDMQESPNQEQVWDEVEFSKEASPVIKEFLKYKKGKIIDLGCGSGRNMIKNDEIEYYGVDFSENQLKQAEKYIKEEKINAKLFKSKADKLNKEGFPDEIFDYGLFIATLHCLETKKERKNALKEFYRVLKPGAEALISVWNSEDKRFNGLKGDIYMSWKKDELNYMRYYYLYDKQEILDLLKDAGFKILEIYNAREHDRFSRKNWIMRVKK